MRTRSVVVPAAPFQRLLWERVEGYDRQAKAERKSSGAFIAGDDPQSGMQRVADELGIDYRALYRIAIEAERIEFSTADKIVTKTVGPMAWMENEELHEIYMGVDLALADLLEPIDAPTPKAEAERRLFEAWDKHTSTKEAAESLGLPAATFLTHVRPILERKGLVVRKGTPKTHCRYGHEIAIYGRTKSGCCRGCKAYRDNLRSRQRRKAAA